MTLLASLRDWLKVVFLRLMMFRKGKLLIDSL